MTGSAVEWIGQIVGLAVGRAAPRISPRSVDDTGGVYVVPAFAGLGAPYWDASARGLICGLSRGHDRRPRRARQRRVDCLSGPRRVRRDVRGRGRAVCAARRRRREPERRADAVSGRHPRRAGHPLRNSPISRRSAPRGSPVSPSALWRDLNELSQLPPHGVAVRTADGRDGEQRLYAGWRDAVRPHAHRATGVQEREH